MKLVDILARELKEWPNDQYESIGQANDGALHKSPNWDSGCGWSKEKYTMAEDWSRVHVTRAQWQAAVDALKPEKKQREAINWATSPEWAKELAINPHGEAAWLGDNGYVYMLGRVFHEWSTPSSFPRECFKVVESRPVVWGEGELPPVGTVCEISLSDGVTEEAIDHERYKHHVGEKVEIIAHHNLGGGGCKAAVYAIDMGLGFEYHSLIKGNFRPIRTPEQIAAEERLKAIESMRKEIGFEAPYLGPCPIAMLYDRGYRKFEIVGE